MDYLRLELGGAINRDPVAVSLHCHAQGFGHCVTGGRLGNLQFVAIIPDGTIARAENNGAFLGDVVRNWGMTRLRAALPFNGVTLESLGLLPCSQRLQCLFIAVKRLLFQPIRPGSALVLVVQLLAFALVLLVNGLDFIFQGFMGLRVQYFF